MLLCVQARGAVMQRCSVARCRVLAGACVGMGAHRHHGAVQPPIIGAASRCLSHMPPLRFHAAAPAAATSAAAAAAAAASGEPWACCPRSALKYALSTLEVVHGLSLMCGFELEFVLLRRAPEGGRAVPDAAKAGVAGWLPVDESVYCQSSSFDEFAYGAQGVCGHAARRSHRRLLECTLPGRVEACNACIAHATHVCMQAIMLVSPN